MADTEIPRKRSRSGRGFYGDFRSCAVPDILVYDQQQYSRNPPVDFVIFGETQRDAAKLETEEAW
jgi:hypothetical protein